MEEKKISIIVPAYNIENYLGRCLDSLLNQTYQNLEIIVVDDGSSDGTASVLDTYAEMDKRIVSVHQENQGVSSARNHGLDLATGDYIGFTDGDDLVEPDMFELLVRGLEEKNVDIAHCGYQMVFPDRVDCYHNSKEELLLNNIDGIYELLSGIKIEPGLWNKLYRRELFEGIRLPNDIAETEDLLCNFELFMHAENSWFIDLPKYHYIVRPGSATNGKLSEKKHRDRFFVVSNIYKKCKNIAQLRAIAYERYIRIILENAQQNDYPGLKRDARSLLQKEYKDIMKDHELGKKLKGMCFGITWMPWLYSLIRKAYELKTGVNHKYEL